MTLVQRRSIGPVWRWRSDEPQTQNDDSGHGFFTLFLCETEEGRRSSSSTASHTEAAERLRTFKTLKHQNDRQSPARGNTTSLHVHKHHTPPTRRHDNVPEGQGGSGQRPPRFRQYAVSLTTLVDSVWLLEMLMEWRVSWRACLRGERRHGRQK